MKETVKDLLADAGFTEVIINKIVNWLDEMGYFTAPASRKYHLAYDGGLAEHSINMCIQLVKLTEKNGLEWKDRRSPYLIGLLHDLCKCDAYRKSKEGYSFNSNTLLRGHGEKSVIIASRLFSLTEEEECCIRYHMGAYHKKDWEGFDAAIRKYPNVLWTHLADMLASKVVEK